MHEEAIEELCVWIDGVDVGHKARGGLRLASRNQALGHEPAERVLVAWHPEQCTDLGEDVEGPRVTGVLELLVTLRRQELQMDALDESATVDADLLGRHADPSVTLSGQMTVEEPPVGSGVDAGRHVVPLHHDRAAEPV